MGWLRDEVLRRADIVEVVSEYLPLKKRGANYWALSPFKPEKTPSFAVSPTKQIFKCFASGKGGDVVRFVMEMEGLSYGEALRKLAEKYDIPLTESAPLRERHAERERYLALYHAAMQFYQRQLAGSLAEAYLQARGLEAATLAAYQLGYAPAEGTALTRHLLQLGYTEDLLVSWGLSARSDRDGHLYDRFRGRVIFPLFDEQGEVVAFAGRLLTDRPDQPKYLNSPDTPFYNKSELLYGLHAARSVLRKGRPALVVEGYMDVLALHQAGFLEAVATCGTALTEGHLARLRRYTRELLLLYDADEAGQAAVQRALLPALQAGFFVRVLSLPDSKDPDEFLRLHTPQEFEALRSQAVSWPIYLAHRSGSTAEARYQLLRQIGQHLQALPDPFMRRAYAQEIAEKLHIPLDFWETYQNVSAAPSPALPQRSPRLTAERELLRVALLYPEVSYGGVPLWRFFMEELRLVSFAEGPAEEGRQALCAWEGATAPQPAPLLVPRSPPAQDPPSGLPPERYVLSPRRRPLHARPLQEDPLALLETNLALLQLHHIQSLLEENLRYLEGISPEEPAYQEHLAIHQVLVEQRREVAHRQGLILPYRKASSEEKAT